MAEEIAQNISPMHDLDVFNSLSNEFDELIRSIGYKHQSCIPAMVEDYDRETHMATVRPLVKYTNYDGESTPWPAFNVSVWRWQSGGFLIDAPLFRGDVGWVIAADRDTQNAKEMNAKIQEKDTCTVKEGKLDYGNGNQGPQIVQNFSMHKWSYGFFIPDSWSHITISDKHKDSLIISKIDGDGKSCASITITPEGVIDLSSDLGHRGVLVNGKPIQSPTFHSGSDSNLKFADNAAGPFASSLTSETGNIYINAYYV